MNTTLLTKDIKLMLKDLKFQIFSIIIVILFVLSAISSAVTYNNLSAEFQKDLSTHNDLMNETYSIQMIHMLSASPLNVISRPSPAVLFSSYSAYPDKINTSIMFYDPTFSKYNTPQKVVFRLNWYFILGILSGFIMLIISFEAISAEKRAGTMRLLSIYGLRRQTILWHKYICYMLLFLIITIPSALVSLLLFFGLTGTWTVVFMLKFLLILLLSIPFASFFTLLGILVSMLKNYRNAIVIIVFLWLFFVIIIPQSANILAKQIAPTKTNAEYSNMQSHAWGAEWAVWNEQYNREVGNNAYLEDGLRAKAVYACGEKVSQIVQMEIDDSVRQTQVVQNIASISPFIQFERISEIVFERGFYLLGHHQDTAKRLIGQIKNLMIEQDSRDETSLHLMYSWAEGDRNAIGGGLVPFSAQTFDHPDLLFVTEIPTDDALAKTMKIMMRLLPILVINIVLVVWCVVKLERLDIR